VDKGHTQKEVKEKKAIFIAFFFAISRVVVWGPHKKAFVGRGADGVKAKDCSVLLLQSLQ